jgi:hypothetical protein
VQSACHAPDLATPGREAPGSVHASVPLEERVNELRR